ncbi:hypothetical protein AA313_de0209145 [Arthrobotrys entomopaga]|nr:hypothetical protein AA313_de0209145 [Arthrobotrys entomopaga]
MGVEQVPYSELITAMNGEETTNKWDILVSYNEDIINKLLDERANANPGITDVPQFSQDVNTGTTKYPDWKTFVYDINLKAPKIKFGAKGQVSVSFPMSGSFYDKRYGPNDPEEIPNGVLLFLRPKLSSIQGTWSKDGWTPSDNPDPKPTDYVTIFEPGDVEARNVCLDFGSIAEIDISIIAEDPDNKDVAEFLDTTARKALLTHFKDTAGYQLYLAGVTNSFEPDEESSTVLRPTAFAITTIDGTSTSPSTICFWIAVEGGANNGKRPSGEGSFTFHPHQEDMCPIPKGSTASIIFSYNLMMDRFFRDGLTSKSAGLTNFTRVTVPEKDRETVSMKFKASLPSTAVEFLDIDRVEGWYHTTIQGFSFNLNDPPADFVVGNKLAVFGTPSVQYSFVNVQPELKWRLVVNSPYDGVIAREGGKTKITSTFKGEGTWTGPTSIDHPNLLGMTIKGLPYEVKAQPIDNLSGWDKLNGGVNEVPPEYKNIKYDVPEFVLEMSPLDYFLTTNLLFPGEHIFISDDPVSLDESTGLSTPKDTILTGSIREIVTTANERGRSGCRKCVSPKGMPESVIKCRERLRKQNTHQHHFSFHT